ncbi:phenylalanine--tRNA ligase subunit beta [Clostridium botulinum]|uniref:phenylalanine--tRNA ligase subunit beta n=1 Tax=unclassified Clostridium TaxID=2614128 RepID=UPI000500DD91|nr:MULTISPECIES: phenylalanine--tRNA ligase subunit beta [unclassified Clostridium]AIY81738.1 phenylalanine--tRNA ligase, beta subunit [Clostridium botulinum 202F]KAI3346858.1 phenylalanine--tRNA ligase subunit beta [Clostridium botulinum]KFX55608.1 phenylalanyl-tRNA synthetase subunit beta [Clostridium botulinum]KON13793.1 phenylalanyl-tRNA synthetase subunit beta [Clostridium botulinum]MBY6777543.1 phenylalanine--tRNA ligase subunit beta [Clostridium botulinum]
MKVPFSWLQDYVDINVSPKELGDKLTLTGSQLEELIIQGDVIDKVVTGKITEIEKHPDADKLSICQVDIGTETIQIVTAATNMKEQDVVPVALHGSTLADGTKIKKGKLRGVPSNGMFCSEEELGIAGDEPVHGLMILPTDTKLGVELKELLKLNKAILDFEITSNRPDCLSIVGMARETAAALRTTYKMPNLEYKVSGNGNVESELNVEVKDDLCLRYMARKVKNVKVKPSPGWMQERLLEAGIRPIDNIVDITNFVMLELGQPMHAYDSREISTNKIVVERAKNGEKFTTLDDVERELDDSMLCIKDDNKIVGLAGIMGGLNSEIKEDTTEVIFESANFDGTNIRVNSKKLNLRSEASGRFEKDIDPNLAKLAIDRACALICELDAGEVIEGTIDIYNKKKEAGKVIVDSNWVNKFLGTNLSKEEMKKCLDSVDLFTEIDGDNLNVTAPTFRIDIAIKEDIAEEIARIHGYDVIPATIFSVATSREPKYRNRLLDDKVVMLATGSGLNQSISYSFVSPKVFDKINVPEDSELRNVVKIKNPLGEDYSVMRTTTIPSMMECLGRNYSRNNDYVRLFEMAKIYIKNEDETKIPTERNILTIGMYGDCDYLDLKGAVENIIDGLGIKNSKHERESENVSYHPGKTAKLVIGKNVVGTLGEVHLDVTENYGIDVPCFIAELNLDALYESADMDRKYKALPKFPAVTRDIALLVEDSILVQEIEECIRKAGGNLVEKVQLFDIYKGKQIPDGKKSIAYAIAYRADKTLTDKEVNKVHDKILRSLEYKLGATLRD